MSILITGGSGWIGRQLIKATDNWPPVIVSRNRQLAAGRTGLPAAQIIQCDLNHEQIAAEQLDGINAVVNLMGDSIADGRWTEDKKKRIRDSRINGTRNLVASLLRSHNLPKVVVSASAVGYYGDREDQILTESEPPADNFLAKTCIEWEQETRPLVQAGVRVCLLRIGIVLGQGGGAIDKMLLPFRLGAGGRLGSGNHWMPWIHLDDLVGMILFMLKNENCSGAFNGTAPAPVTNRQFTKTLGKAVGRPTLIPVPRFALRMLFGEFADFLFLSQRVVPKAIQQAGFEFKYPTIDESLKQIVG